MKNSILRRMPIQRVIGRKDGSRLLKTLGAFDLTMMGIGVILGSGIFVITGVAAAEHAGPGLVFSFLLAGIACGCAALCYAELASAIPASGGAYAFVYVGMGEVFAWFIGWCLTLEYVVAMSAVAAGWSAYVSNVLSIFDFSLPPQLMNDPSAGGLVNLPAVAVITLMALLQLKGSKESARLNTILVIIKLAVILLFLVLVTGHIDVENYHPFLPFGWGGVFSGAAVVFFAYLGFDAIANSAEEVKNPQKNMPRGIIGSLVIATILYVAVTLVLTGVIRYSAYGGVAAPIAFALGTTGAQWGSALVSAGAIAGLTTGVLVFLGSESRLLYSMARDGLLPGILSKVNRNGVPVLSLLCVWLTGSAAAGLLPIGTIAELCNMGTLWAFLLVSVTVILLRSRFPGMHRGFKVPAVPLVPGVAMLMCAFLAFQLSAVTWKVFAAWSFAGMCIYFLYGSRKSRLH